MLHRSTRALAGIALLCVSLLATACPPTTGGGTAPQLSNFQLRASKVTVVNHNDNAFYGAADEPYMLNLWFRVKVGVPNSTTVGIAGSRDNALSNVGNGEVRVLSGGQRSAASFNDVQLLDLADLLNANNHLEVTGTWSWAMEKDDVSINGVANSTLNVIRNALNATVAAGSLPSDPSQLVSAILGSFGQAFNLIAGALFGSVPGIPDDALNSKFFIGLGTKGTLGDIVDASVGTVTVPSIAIPIISVPPDINGGRIFSMDTNIAFPGEQFPGDGRHDYDMEYVNTGTPGTGANQFPVSSFAPSAVTGVAPLGVSFDASASNDPDGTIATYAWDFGDFTTGTGVSTTHTFTTGGNFPVSLTVTDNRGDTATTTINIAVGGAPTAAPTGLQLVGSGSSLAETWGDFQWNKVAGAEAYEIKMISFFGGGCLTDVYQEFTGQRASGTVNRFGLCLGSKYDTSIRARANGIWGPWSPSQRFTL